MTFTDWLEFSNELVSTAIVIIAVSMLLYNITRNAHDRVNRASSYLLGTVTVAYLADVFITADPGPSALENWFRVQWIGLAFLPATMFHLSDALLATTGLVSRGRRRRAVRVLYAVGIAFTLAALTTDAIVHDLTREPVWHMRPGSWFGVYVLYYFIAIAVSFVNVMRAWQRCLTTYTRRRMSYLLGVFLAPAWGLFPYSLLFSAIFSDTGDIPETWLWVVFNVANLGVLATLAFMAYPLSFFGAYKPDRVVKAELLQFMLRGPLMGVIIISLILTLPRVSSVLGIEGTQFTAFAAVAIILFFQWMITLIMPALERWLIFTSDQQQAHRLRAISERLITRADAARLQEAILAAICDQLRVSAAFIVPAGQGETHFEQVGSAIPLEEQASTHTILVNGFSNIQDDESVQLEDNRVVREGDFFLWRNYWLVPLYNNAKNLLGVLGIQARNGSPHLSETEARIFDGLRQRASRILMDVQLQNSILSSLEDLVPASETDSRMVQVSPYGQVEMQSGARKEPKNTRKSPVFSEEYVKLVKEALRDYWGGPRLTESKLLDLNLVDAESEADESRINALRRVLNQAIESLRPEGKQNLTRPDWMMYNILEMRFLQGRKVRDVAPRLAMSSADFYRKQRLAIQEVARIIAENEQQLMKDNQKLAHQEDDTTLLPSDA